MDAWVILATAGADHLGRYMFVAGDGMKKRRSVGNKHVGSSLNEFLQEEGVLEETRSIATKEVVAWQIEQAILKGNITKVEMAKRTCNSRAALNRLLDPADDAGHTADPLPRRARYWSRAAHRAGVGVVPALKLCMGSRLLACWTVGTLAAEY
jgi:antitoxin HicB